MIAGTRDTPPQRRRQSGSLGMSILHEGEVRAS